MEMEKQVVSPELAIRMEELGFAPEFPADTLFAWLPFGKGYGLFYNWTESKDKPIFAYTVAELGEMLPSYVNTVKGRTYYHREHIQGLNYQVAYLNMNGSKALKQEFNTSEADARAKMLIYLAENNLINPKQL